MIGFMPGVVEHLDFYVYLLIDPRDSAVFYVGKGIGDRCFAHLAEAQETDRDSVGDYPKLARIREIESTGAEVRVDILRHGLSEYEAFLIESAIIDLLGLHELENYVRGHGAFEHGRMSVDDINAKYGAKPIVIAHDHRVVLIRINRQFKRGMSAAELYEATRKWWQWWRIASYRRQLGAPTAPDWAMAVYGNVVRAVFRINAWNPAPDDAVQEDPSRSKRWGFTGSRDTEMEALYQFGDVTAYLRNPEKRGASQTPLRYINC